VIARLAAAAVLLLAAALRLWRLDQNGFDNEYYAAAVRSMTESWHNFLYNAFDPAGFVSVDKPPLALWIQVASAKFFGYSWWSVLLPQVLEGVGAVGLVMYLVWRQFGGPAGVLAGLFLAVTPVSVAVDRSSNTDSALVFVLLLAAWALIRACEEGSRALLLLAMALVGLAFNIKMMAAYVLLPTFVLVYFLGAPVPWRRRSLDLILGGLVLVAVSLPWIVAYDLTPPAQRPYVGSSPQNSMLDLAVGHNAVGRFVRLWKPRGQAADQTTTPLPIPTGSDGLRTARGGLFVRAPVGGLRLADGQLAAQVGWLFPLALMGLALFALRERPRLPLNPVHRDVVLWTGWGLSYGIVYSYAGGIFHFYYMLTLAPPLAALAGIGVVALYREGRARRWGAVLLPLGLLLTAAWQLYVGSSALRGRFEGWERVLADLSAAREPAGDWRAWLGVVLVAGVLIAAALLLLRLPRVLAAGALAVGIAALLVTPAAWALSSVLVKGVAVIPSADLARLGPPDRGDSRAGVRAAPMDTRALIDFLKVNRLGERYLLATSSATLAAPLIIETGEPVMAIGGFHGLDTILTPARLALLVETRKVRFVMRGDLSPTSAYMGGEAAGRPITEWIRAHGRPVDPAHWRASAMEPAGGEEPAGGSPRRGARDRMSSMVLWDLRPAEGLVSR
jgi:4-amino-4-deoxy-L-arabinose transferase-like glycosyltransferase